MPTLRISKGQALGNDYLVVDGRDLPLELTPAIIRRICDRHLGLGSDGILVGDPGARPISLRIYNPDGSEAEKSGNGLRIFAAWLYARGEVGRERFPVRLPRDDVALQVLEERAGGVLLIEADMGRASFRGEDVGFEPEPGEALGSEVSLEGGESAVVNPVSLSNPHCVVFVDALERQDFLRRAPQLAVHEAFAAGTNVQFARPLGPATLEAWIWERGAGETLASGSSACAVAAAAYRLGLVGERALEVRMPGGSVEIELREDGMVRLRGPAQMVYRAEVPVEVLAGR